MKLTATSMGKKLEHLLGIRGAIPKEFQNWQEPSTSSSSSNRPYEPPQKKFKPNPQMSIPIIPTKQKFNKRGNKGGKKNNNNNKGNKPNNGNGNKGQNQNRPNQNRDNNQGKQFQKGKKESNK